MPLLPTPLYEHTQHQNSEMPMSAAMINQYLYNHIVHMPAPAFAEFKDTFEHVLMTQAQATISTEQIITLMLSSAPS